MSIFEPQSEDKQIGHVLLVDRFDNFLKKFADDESVRREAEGYQAFCAKRYQCEKDSAVSFMFLGFVFGLAEGMEIDSDAYKRRV